MKKKSLWQRSKLFVLSFLGALVVFGLMFAATYYLVILRNEQAGNTVTQLPVTEEYIPKQGDELTLAVMGCKDRAKTPQLFFLIRFDPMSSRCTVIELPDSTLVSADGSKKTLADHYDYGGTEYCTQVISDLFLLEQPVYYVRLDPLGIQKMVDFFSGFQYYVPQELLTDDYHFEEGEQLLDGRRVGSLLFSPAFSQRADLMTVFFRNSLTQRLAYQLDDFYDLLFSQTDTNLNRAVLNELDRPVHAFLRSSHREFFPLSLRGTVTGQGMIPDETQLSALRAQLSQSQIT